MKFLLIQSVLLTLFQLVKLQTYVVFTMGGDGTPGFQDGMGTVSKFNEPIELVTDMEKNVYVADKMNHRIRKISRNGMVSTLVGDGEPGLDDGPLSSAHLSEPHGIAIDVDGGILVADKNNFVIRKIKDERISTVYGNVDLWGQTIDGQGTETAAFTQIAGLHVSSTGEIVVCEFESRKVRFINGSGYVSTVANQLFGVRKGVFDNKGSIFLAVRFMDTVGKLNISNRFSYSVLVGPNDGKDTNTRLGGPISIFHDPYDNMLYLADLNNHAIRKLDPSTGKVSNFAGSKTQPGMVNGPLSAATFRYPHGVTVDFEGDVYVADWGNHIVRKIMYCPANANCSDMTGYTCLFGFGKNITTRSCNKCRDDQLFPAPESRMSCINCPQNASCSGGSSFCLSGYEYNPDTSACTQCQLGQYKSTIGNEKCQACPIGTESLPDRSSCLSCISGKYRPSLNYSNCIDCPPNSKCSGASFSCLAGYEYYEKSTLSCVACPPGQFKNTVANTKCQICPFNSTCSGFDFSCLSGYEFNSTVNACIEYAMGKLENTAEGFQSSMLHSSTTTDMTVRQRLSYVMKTSSSSSGKVPDISTATSTWKQTKAPSSTLTIISKAVSVSNSTSKFEEWTILLFSLASLLIILIVLYHLLQRRWRRMNNYPNEITGIKQVETSTISQASLLNSLVTLNESSEPGGTSSLSGSTLIGKAGLAIPAFLQYQYQTDLKCDKKLSEGGGGIVFLASAFHHDLSKYGYVVVKEYKSMKSSQMFMDAFYQELSLMYMLREHKNIAEFLGYCERPCCLIIKYYPLGSLKSYLFNAKKITGKMQVQFCLDISSGLEYMVKNGVAHCDLKSANILLKNDTNSERIICVLTDFGLSTLINRNPLTVGSFRALWLKGHSSSYASPELISRLSGNAEYPFDSFPITNDIYSLSCVICEILTRKIAWFIY